MKQKLLDIKLILRIIISVLIIFSMLKSCVKALTSEDVSNYIDNTADYFSSNTNYQYIKSNSHKNYVVSFINQYSSNFDNFACFKDGSYVEYKFFNASNGKITGATDSLVYSGTYTAMLCDNSSVIWTQTNRSESNSSIDYGRSYSSTANKENTLLGMSYITQEITGTTPNTWVGMQAVVPQVTIYFGNMFSTTITYNGEEMQANELNYNYRSDFIDNVVTEDNEITSMQATLNDITLECNDLGSYWNLVCPNSTLLKYNQIYTLNVQAIVNGNEEEIEEKMIFIPPGTTISGGVITNIPSGDYNFNTENATNQIIENQQQQQQENKSFFENLYNNLFTISSGEVSGEVNKLIASLNLETSGEQQIVSMIYDEFNKEPTDFIISWQPAALTIEGKTIQIIPSGEINFSEKCREEPSLARVKGIVNVITSAYLLIVLLIANQDMILRLLGTENRFLDSDKDELIVDVQGIAYEQLPYTTNLPTYSGTDPNYWWHRARKRF